MTAPLLASCPTGKLVYPSPQLANQALVAIMGHRHRRPKQWIRHAKPVAYKCHDCNGWHLSSGSKHSGRPL